MKEKEFFSFGKNWQNYLKKVNVNKERLQSAKSSLVDFLELKNIKNKTFLDIGCGTGLFSYAAFHLHAKKIVSFDVDQCSVECCKYFHKKANSPKNWEIYQGSILDKKFISKLEKFDIVYSWGVLHHTGKMWEAIKNSAELVKKNGYFYIAIYNTVEGRKGSKLWLKIKKIYNSSPAIGKYILEILYMLSYFLIHFARLRNPLASIKNYKSNRGMNWRVDVTDWLGGYPYEFASVEEIFKFMKINFPDFELINLMTTNGLGSNWYLFKRNI